MIVTDFDVTRETRHPWHRLRQPLTSPARCRNLAINSIRTLKQRTDTPDDLVLLGKGWEWNFRRNLKND